MEQLVQQLLLLGGFVYALLEFVKPVYDPKSHIWNFDAVAALAFGIVLTVLAQVDLFALGGISFQVPYVGEVLSGVLVGGSVGAGLIHDFPDWLKSLFTPKT